MHATVKTQVENEKASLRKFILSASLTERKSNRDFRIPTAVFTVYIAGNLHKLTVLSPSATVLSSKYCARVPGERVGSNPRSCILEMILF